MMAAYHEAGHVVMNFLLGFAVKRATVDSGVARCWFMAAQASTAPALRPRAPARPGQRMLLRAKYRTTATTIRQGKPNLTDPTCLRSPIRQIEPQRPGKPLVGGWANSA